jgi:RNA ligase
MPLAILNYTERCQYERAWTHVTRTCRGLIVNTETGAVVARPFEKFFNYSEHDEATLSLDEPVTITDKMDGSLGIIYRGTDGQLAVATRGSFTSEQAIHATTVLRDRYAAGFEPWAAADEFTHLVEIVYPGNRIVVDYGATDDLYYLGNVHIASGDTQGPAVGNGWPGPQATVFDGGTLADALAIEPRPGMEGIVVHYWHNDLRIKIKQDDYVILHRLITGMNARVVWERIGAGETAEDLCAGIPEEFWPWVREVGSELIREKNRIIDEAIAEHARVVADLPDGWTRKDYAMAVAQSPLRPWLFNLLDDRDPSEKIWRTLRPSGERSMTNYSEDTA